MVAQHPTHDELNLYLLDSLPTGKSLRIAEHLLLCPTCVEASAEIEDWISYSHVAMTRPQPVNALIIRTPAHVQRRSVALLEARRSHHASYGVAAALIVALGVGTMTFHRMSISQQPSSTASIPASSTSSPAAHRLEISPPAPSVENPQPVVRKLDVRATVDVKPAKRFARPFVPPVSVAFHQKPRLLTPPTEFSYSVASMGSIHLASLPADLDDVPQFQSRSGKRNLLVRFFTAIAKPFRSNGTSE